MVEEQKIIIENIRCRLTLDSDCIVRSLIIKETGEEVLKQGEEMAFFSVTQERPYNNEVKLAYPNKRMTFQGNSLCREGNRLIIGFEIIPYKAVVEVKETDSYLAFKLVDFVVSPECYGDLIFTPPPVAEFRLIQLPVKNRRNYGDWLNVMWDEAAAVNVLSTSPYENINSERRKDFRVMTADAVNGIRLLGCEAALIATPTDLLLQGIAKLEEDYALPKGVESRQNNSTINASICWAPAINPQNVDEHIAYAKKGGFRMMLIYYTSIVEEKGVYELCGNYDYLPEYPNGRKDLEEMLKRIREAGITPGLHFLHTHIGLKSRYVTPVVDHRINLTRHFTLAKSVSFQDTKIYVEQNPENTVMHPKCRYLNFGGELISYEAYSTEEPYCFIGCKRGAYDTKIAEHPKGLIGGILDISEFCGNSAYINQNTSLQEEIADKIADIYNAGFQFAYFDGSEGTNIPHGHHVPNA